MIGRTTSSRVASLLLVLVPLIVLSQSTVASQIPVTLTTTYAETHTSTNYVSTPISSYTYTTTSMTTVSSSFRILDKEAGDLCYFDMVPFTVAAGDDVTFRLSFRTNHMGGAVEIVITTTPTAVYYQLPYQLPQLYMNCNDLRSGEYHVGTLYLGGVNPDVKCDPPYYVMCMYQFTWKPNSSGRYYLLFVNKGDPVTVDVTLLVKQAATSTSTQYSTQTALQPYTISSTSVYTTQLLYTSSGQLSLVVALSLVVVIIGAVLYSRSQRRRPSQAKLTHFPKPTCVKCGVDLPPNSKFCKECGAKQP